MVADGEDQQIYVWQTETPVFNQKNTTTEVLPYLRREVNWLAWSGGNNLILSLKEKGLVLYDADNRRLRPLIDPLTGGGPRPNELPPLLISVIPAVADKILMQWEDPSVPGFPAVYEVDITNGTSRKIVGAWKPVVRWWASSDGGVHVGEGYRNRRHQIFSRDRDGGWQQIHEHDVFRHSAYVILNVQDGGEHMLVVSENYADKRALWRADIRTGKLLEKLASDDVYDIEGAVFDEINQTVIAASYSSLQAEQVFLDETYEEVHQDILKRLRRRPVDDTARLWFVGMNINHDKRLYQLRSEKHPSRYFFHDLVTDQLVDLEGNGIGDGIYDDFHRTTAVEIPISRDSDIPPMQGILSVPKAENGKLTLSGKGVLLIHGGPVRRSRQQYNRLVNWLTANGYVVLQPNFRGSSGFGKKWRKAGYGEWGADMQRDITAAANWLIREGYVDKDRLCAIGGSYGGYASMMAVLKSRKQIQCAVSLNGVTSIPHLVDYLSNRRFSYLTTPRIKGSLSKRTLERRSPLYLVRNIRRPILLLHATKDLNVPFEHSQYMAEALKRTQKEHEFIILTGAEHQLKYPRYRKTYYENALRFLEKYVGKKSD
jgi:dipeptidyl aminopeptidase/acylaminoacyl peptidase